MRRYLVISGSEVPAQRSYVMTATVLVAVLLDRPALTMRSVALAALIVLALAPESLMQPGFQMSFAATIALVAAFEALRGRAWWQHTQTAPGWRFAKPVVGIAMTSLVAGAATAPISAFHFNAVAQYGLIANLLAIPAMGMVVMPAAVIAVVGGAVRARLAAVPGGRARHGLHHRGRALRRRARRGGDRRAVRAAGEPRR